MYPDPKLPRNGKSLALYNHFSGYLGVSIHKNSIREHQLNTMGTLSGLHPSLSLEIKFRSELEEPYLDIPLDMSVIG